MDTTFSLVVPCYDEARRLHEDELVRLLADRRVRLVLVDDGSTDSTLQLLRGIEQRCTGIEVLALPRNVGKGEAVRIGLRHALHARPDWVGYLDADLATPPAEVVRLIDVALDVPEREVVLGSRVALLGRRITRSPFRHYTGRVFATFASLALQLPVYDTQCGAKLLRRTDALALALQEPFRSRWAFDVELIGRLVRSGTPLAHVWEEPLVEWSDASRSRRSVSASVAATISLLAVRRDLARWPTRST